MRWTGRIARVSCFQEQPVSVRSIHYWSRIEQPPHKQPGIKQQAGLPPLRPCIEVACYTAIGHDADLAVKLRGGRAVSRKMQIPMPLDLPGILSRLAEHCAELRRLGVRSLGLFGSYRTGETHAESDLDFLVVLERPSFRDYMAIKLFLESLFERRVDLVLAESLKPRIRAHILKDVVYAEGTS